MNKVKNWICNGNDCAKCKYSWEARTAWDCDEWDCGCYIKGEDFDDKPCHLINPFKFIIGTLKMRAAHYYEAHSWDGFMEFSEEMETKNEKLKNLFIEKVITCHVICFEASDGELIKCNTESVIGNNIWEVRTAYEDFAYPDKTLSQEWKELISKTLKRLYARTIGRIVPYIHG